MKFDLFRARNNVGAEALMFKRFEEFFTVQQPAALSAT